MPENQIIKTKIALKQNTFAYWNRSDSTTQSKKTHGDYVPLYGEVCFCEIPAKDDVHPNNGASTVTNPPAVLFKVGDGWTPFKNLQWASALAADVYEWAKQEQIYLTKEAKQTVVTKDEKTSIYTGNAFTDISWDPTANNGKGGIKLVKETQFATKQELDEAIESFTGGIGSINDTDTKYDFSIEETGKNAGKLKIVATTYTDKVAGTPVTEYIDLITADKLKEMLPSISIAEKKEKDTENEIYVVTNLSVDSTDDHKIIPSYASVPTQKYVNDQITQKLSGIVSYLGTVKNVDELNALAPQNIGDFARVSEAFGEYHASDMLICETLPIDNPITGEKILATWSVIHGEIDANTWVANSKDADGYVAKGAGNGNKIWKTDGDGNPAWRDEEQGRGTIGIASSDNGVVTLKRGATLSGHSLSNTSEQDIVLEKIATSASIYDLKEANTGTNDNNETVTYFVLDCNW